LIATGKKNTNIVKRRSAGRPSKKSKTLLNVGDHLLVICHYVMIASCHFIQVEHVIYK